MGARLGFRGSLGGIVDIWRGLFQFCIEGCNLGVDEILLIETPVGCCFLDRLPFLQSVNLTRRSL